MDSTIYQLIKITHKNLYKISEYLKLAKNPDFILIDESIAYLEDFMFKFGLTGQTKED